MKYSFLKSKAAPVRHVADFALQFAYNHALGTQERPVFAFGRNYRLHGREQQHSDFLVSMFRGMEWYVRSLHEAVFDERVCKDSMFVFLRSLAGLNALWRVGLSAEEQKRQPCHIRPKCHLLQHVIQDCMPVTVAQQSSGATVTRTT